MRDLPELPAALYLTEVSHHYGGRAYCFGGGLYNGGTTRRNQATNVFSAINQAGNL